MMTNEIRCENCTDRHCNGCKSYSNFANDKIKFYSLSEYRIDPGYVYRPYIPLTIIKYPGIQISSGATS